jgi:hypothetical protein
MHVVYFPWMHPEGASHVAGTGVSFLDPGLGSGRGADGFWVPGDLPLNSREALRYMQEALSFGERFQDPKELEYVRAAGLEDFFSGTAPSLSDELERRLREQAGGSQDQEQAWKKRGQMALLLNWMWEEKLLEVQSGEQHYYTVMSQLRENLGVKEAEGGDDLGLRKLSESPGGGDPSRWPGLMPWFLLFLPADGVLYIDDRRIREELGENGIEPVSLSRVSGYEEVKRLVGERGMACDLGLGPGWRLALRSRPEPEMPWLDWEYPVLLGNG